VKYFKVAAVLLLLSSCAGPQGCFPRFADLKTQYPYVIYHGPKLPSEIIIKKAPPPSWVPLAQISRKAQGAIIVSEDWAFYTHPGYDEKQIHEAITQSLEAGKLKRGASTITQQVVRNIYLSKEKSLIRKGRELWMATKIEKVLGKKRILELYLNIAEWDEGVFGIGPAAHHYFNKTPAELTAKEGAFLAMLLPSPKKYAISFRKHTLTPYARKIIRSVLNKMVKANYLTLAERDAEWIKPLSFEENFDATIPTDASMEDIDNLDEDKSDGDSNDSQESLPSP
jgi:monofunctional biosynthetic peptidoglycan transglycosylase